METNSGNTQELADRTLNQLIAAVEAGESEQLKAYLATVARFHRYSISNSLLIMAQFPGASRVAGYRTWQRLGRQVRRGSKAIRIFAPVIRRARRDDDEDEVAVAFRTVGVFDISQTDGTPLPQPTEPKGDPGEHIQGLKHFVAGRGISLEYSDSLGAAEGVCRGSSIVLRQGLSPAAEFSVLAHELAHALMHQGKASRGMSQTVRETEAEAVAFVVCQAIGLNDNGSAADYIQLYQGKKETLVASLERIRMAASTIIRAILPEEHMAAA